jgi:hypothetical protein
VFDRIAHTEEGAKLGRLKQKETLNSFLSSYMIDVKFFKENAAEFD